MHPSLREVTLDHIWNQFENGDPALRQVFAHWKDEDPLMTPESFSQNLDQWVRFHATTIAQDGPIVSVHRMMHLEPSHWEKKAPAGVEVGRHWSLVREKAYVMGHGIPAGGREYLLSARINLTDIGQIDWPATLAANIMFGDQEYEIVLRPGSPVDLIAIRDLDADAELAVMPAQTGGKRQPSAIMPFNPRIWSDRGSTFYDDGRVHGSVDAFVEDGKDGLVIHEWSSHHPGNGHSVEALTWLRSRYCVVKANGVGSIDEDGDAEPTVLYWQHMKDKGLVDVLILDDGTEFEPVGAPSP